MCMFVCLYVCMCVCEYVCHIMSIVVKILSSSLDHSGNSSRISSPLEYHTRLTTLLIAPPTPLYNSSDYGGYLTVGFDF